MLHHSTPVTNHNARSNQELVDKGKEHGVHVPRLVLRMALHMVTGSVKKAAGFNINSLSPVQHVTTCTVPALFVTAENDDFISPSHAEQLYEVGSVCVACARGEAKFARHHSRSHPTVRRVRHATARPRKAKFVPPPPLLATHTASVLKDYLTDHWHHGVMLCYNHCGCVARLLHQPSDRHVLHCRRFALPFPSPPPPSPPCPPLT